MIEGTPDSLVSSPSPLDSETLRDLVLRWRSAPDIPNGWKPRKRLEAFVSDAFHLAALIDESDSALVPREEAQALREIALAAGALDHEARRVRADHTRANYARSTRREARHFMSEVLGALHYLARSGLEDLAAKLAKVSRQQKADDCLAGEIELVHEIAHAHQMLLSPLGVSREFVQSAHRLSFALRQISADRMGETQMRTQATDARNRVLFALSQRISNLSATLRYVYRRDREWLARIARPSLRKP